MIAITLLAVLLFSPLALWYSGLNTLAIFALIFVGLSLPSIVKVVYLAIKHREWPKVVGGPSIMWVGRRYGL